MSNVIPRRDEKDEVDLEGIEVYTQQLMELNAQSQDAVRDFALHDIDDQEGIERELLEMHDTMTKLYDQVARFSEDIMTEDFDMAYLRERISQAEGESKQQLEQALEELQVRSERNLSEVWMAKVMAWLHQAAAASSPFIDKENAEKADSASRYLSAVYTMLERPFTAVARKTDGTTKLRRVALGHMAHELIKEAGDEAADELAEIIGKNKAAEAEFYDEFLNELISKESTFRQAFNPFDEIVWRDILSTFVFEQATDLYNEAIPSLDRSSRVSKDKIAATKSWKQNTAGLSEVYLAMTYTDIADTQMRAGNLEDASKLYMTASEAFGRAEKCFAEALSLQGNAEQSRSDKEHKKAQALFCSAEAAVGTLTDLLRLGNKDEAILVLKEIFRNLRKSEKLSNTRELTAAIKENLRIFSFVEEQLKKDYDTTSSILDQIELAKGIRREGLIQDVNKSLDDVRDLMGKEPPKALESIREGLTSLGILLSLETEDDEITELRNRTLALLNNVKYVIQFRLSSQLQHGVNFIQSRILENLHAKEAATYYKVVGEPEPAEELTDLGKLAVATAYASEAQIFARQAEQWAFRAQIERAGTLNRLEDEISQIEEDEDALSNAIEAHENSIQRIKHTMAAFQSASEELASVQREDIRKKNNVEDQVQQLQGVVMKFKGDFSRLMGAKSDFMAEYESMKGEPSKARKHYTDASDWLRQAVGNYSYAAQVFQQIGDASAAQNVDTRAQTADLLARSVWDNRQRLERDQEPKYKGEAELAALYLGTTGGQG
ncbi:hypothetical protein EU538_01695 [Candidatus Thorarchaeota archaeon]|nr:MAG: hypothetical protein EU538_01695 [Candidatus Thorarchaeota archaeon]